MTKVDGEDFTEEQIQAMRDHPLRVAKRLLGPDAGPAALKASARLVALLGNALAQAGPGETVALETRGRLAGSIAIIKEAVDDPTT